MDPVGSAHGISGGGSDPRAMVIERVQQIESDYATSLADRPIGEGWLRDGTGQPFLTVHAPSRIARRSPQGSWLTGCSVSVLPLPPIV